MGDQPIPTGRAAHSHEVTNTIMNRRNLTTLLTTALLAALPAASAHASSDGTTRGSTAALPDGRSYELASPAEKNGSDVMIDSSRTRAASDGNAVSFTSLGGFADVRGTGLATEYMAERSSSPAPGGSGWETHAITPAQKPLSLLASFQALDPLWEGEFSDDLTHGVFRAWSPVTDEPNVANVENLYVRDDLRSPGPGSYQLATGCPACTTPIPGPAQAFQLGRRKPRLTGASKDFSHLLFESRLPLTSDASPGVLNLFESVNGSVRLAGVLPDGSPAPQSVAGQGATPTNYTPRVISDDGARIEFTDNSATGGSNGELYQRVNGSSAVQINASERTDCATDPTCGGNGVPDPAPDPAGHQLATYWSASTDGTRVFFTTAEQLTDDDTNTSIDLYMYDAHGSGIHHLTRLSVDGNPIDPPNDVQGVIGASTDGHYVYFIAAGQLDAMGPTLAFGTAIYVWHGGVVSYVGELGAASYDTSSNYPTTWLLNQLRSRVSLDGHHLLFVSHSGASLGGYDQSGCAGGTAPCQELYVYTIGQGTPVCVSCDPSGARATTDADDTARVGTSASDNTWHLSHPLSDDGRYVFFNTAQALVPADANGKIDVYEYDVQTGAVHLISGGTDPSDSYFMDASPSGQDVFFLTRQQLVGWDTDKNYDLYDARINGGFPEPSTATPPCAGDSCRGAAPPVPSTGAQATNSYRGPGDVKSAHKKAKPRKKAVRCKRGYVRKHVKHKVTCVKKRPAKHANSKGQKGTK
jgi:hypothetical protein